jgi:peptide/nickel transport system permease protein
MLLRRLGTGLLTLWLVSVLIFVAIHILPGNAAMILEGHPGDDLPGTLQLMEKQMGLNRPLAVQYWTWLTGLLTLHWGTSLVSMTSVSFVIKTRLVNSAILALFTTAIAVPLSLGIGIYSATRSGKASDNALSLVSLCLSAIPGFVLGILLIFFFATNVFHDLPAASIVNPQVSIWDQLTVTVLPVATLVISGIPYPIRFVRASMIDILQSDYVLTARLKGLSERRVLFHHALRNGIATMIQAFALQFLFLLGGVILIETVFSYPGLGLVLVQSVNARDVPMIQTIVVMLAAFIVFGNLLTDIAVILATPRLRARL